MSKEPETEIINENEGSEQLPSPPPEHTEELKMEKRLKHILEQMKKLSPEELQYYSRQIMLDEVGYEGQSKLKKAKICIVGLGGLGSIIATQLAAAGVGHLRLVDRDIVEESNLQRQHLYSFDFLGYPKVEAAIERLKRVNPYIELEPLPLSFNAHNASG
ncbi:MAG: ThiF family adenylyltransferase, partial [Candidatus Bathyarchaeota archaeon]